MDEKQRNISQLERVVSSFEYHLEKYKESKCKSKNGRLQKDRKHALDDMFTHAKYMKAELEQVYPIISDGSPSYIQFEDFGKYAESDVPDYIKTLKNYIEKLKQDTSESVE